jgi:hypothetical protein
MVSDKVTSVSNGAAYSRFGNDLHVSGNLCGLESLCKCLQGCLRPRANDNQINIAERKVRERAR